MGLEISVGPEGVDALRQLSTSLLDELDTIGQIEDRLRSTYDDVSSLVAHENEISNILEGVDQTSAGTAASVAELSSKVAFMAKRLEDFISRGLGGSGN